MKAMMLGTIVAAILCFVVAIVLAIIGTSERTKACNEAGGIYLMTRNSSVCVRADAIIPL